MKTKILFLFFLVQLYCYGQESWYAVGADDFNKASYGQTQSAAKKRLVVKNNHAFVFNIEEGDYGSSDNKTHFSIGKWNGTKWEHIDLDVLSANVESDGAVDNNENPYLFFNDPSHGNSAVVKMHNGTVWVTVGNTAISSEAVSFQNLAIGSDNLPYVLYKEGDTVKLKKFDGSNWILLNDSSDLYPFSNITMELDRNNTPYVMYNYGTFNNGGCFIKKFNGSGWQEVGITDFSVQGQKLQFDQNNVPHLISGNTIKKFNGSSWEQIASFSIVHPSQIQWTPKDIAFDMNNKPYVLLNSYITSYKIATLENNSWTTVKTSQSYQSAPIAFDNNILYQLNVAFGASGNNFFPEVSRLSGSNWETIQDQSYYTGRAESVSTFDFSICNGYPMVVTKNPVAVRLFSNNSWELIGQSGQSESTVIASKIKSGTDGKIYIAYNNKTEISSTSTETKITVKKLTDNGWQPLGAVNFSLISGAYLDLKLNHANEPFILYKSGRLQKFNGNDWEFIGGSAYTGDLNAELSFDNSDEPYIAFIDPSNNRVAVKKFNGNIWEYIDQPGLSAYTPSNNDNYSNTKNPRLFFDNNNSLYLAFVDNNQQIHIKKLQGSNWQSVGPETVGNTNLLDISIDRNNTIYVLYNEISDNFRREATLKKFNGSDWELVGEANFSAGTVLESKIAFNNDNVPFVTYMSLNGIFTKYFGPADLLHIIKQQPASIAQRWKLAPNPVKNTFSISENTPFENIDIYNLIGKRVFSSDGKSNQFDISFLKSGIYIVKIKSANETASVKLVKE